jgi:hypothetical protein
VPRRDGSVEGTSSKGISRRDLGYKTDERIEMLDAVDILDGVRSNDVNVAEDGEDKSGKDADETVGVSDGIVCVSVGIVCVSDDIVGERVDSVDVAIDIVTVMGDAVGVTVDGEEGVGESEGGDGGIGADTSDIDIVSGTVLSLVPGVTGEGLGLRNEVSIDVSRPSGMARDCTEGEALRTDDS